MKGQNKVYLFLYVIVSLNIKNDKSLIKQLRKDNQLKLCFFMVYMTVNQFLTSITGLYTKMKQKIESSTKGYIFFGLGTKPEKTNKMVLHVSLSTFGI